AYDDTTGGIVYFSIPTGATVNPNLPSFPHNVAKLYFPVYPVGSGVGTLNCQHTPTSDNCPDHGPAVAGFAAQVMPGVYGNADGSGVAGHDHLIGIASTGGEFNVEWLPVAVLFTNPAAATQHLTTLSQVDDAVNKHHVAIEVPLQPFTFHGEVVSASVYQHAT